MDKPIELTRVAWYIADKVVMDVLTAKETNYPVTVEFLWKDMNFYSSCLPAFGYEKLTVTEKEKIADYVVSQFEEDFI